MRRRIVLASLALCLALALLPMYAGAAETEPIPTSGTWGSLNWNFNETTGELSITGTGPMDNMVSTPPAFRGHLKNTKRITIGEGIESIGAYVFQSYDAVVSIPSTVTTIGKYAFGDCTFTSLTIPNGVTTIGERAFQGCNGLTSLTIPGSVTTIGTEAFSECKDIEELTIQGGGVSIGTSAFSGCRQLTTVRATGRIESVGGYAFSTCYRLSSFTVDGDVGFIDGGAFGDCGSSEGSPGFTVSVTGRIGRVGSTGSWMFASPVFSGCNLTSFTAACVDAIGASAFQDCQDLSVFDVPSVGAVGEHAFSGCNSLTELTLNFPEGSAGTIGSGAFYGENPSKITITGVRSIEKDAFRYLNVLTSVSISGRNADIGEGAFCACTNLTDLSLTGIRSIGADAFRGVEGLVRVTLPEGLEEIGEDAFASEELTSIYIPASVKTIHERAFRSCDMRDVYFGGSQTQWDALGGTDTLFDPYMYRPKVHCGSTKLPDYYIVNNEAELRALIQKGYADGVKLIDIRLGSDISVSGTLEIPRDYSVRIDLYGHDLTSSASPVIRVEGELTVWDFPVDIAKIKPTVRNDNTVDYRSGSIIGDRTVVSVEGGGCFMLRNGTIRSRNHVGISVRGDYERHEQDSLAMSIAEIQGGYVEAQESALLVLGDCPSEESYSTVTADVSVYGGVLLSRDNAVIAGNGLPQYAGTSISISHGILIGLSETPGYIGCGVYHPQDGHLTIYWPTMDDSQEIRVPNGVGVLMRGGSLHIEKNPNFTIGGSGTGKVGDAGQPVPAGKYIVLDQKSGYYDNRDIRAKLQFLDLTESPEFYPEGIPADGCRLDYIGDYTYTFVKDVRYTVTFSANGGAFADGSTELKVETVGDKIFSSGWPRDYPTRPGYVCSGWYTEATGGQKIANYTSHIFTGDTTLYAHWYEENPYTPKYKITFDFNYEGARLPTEMYTNREDRVDFLPSDQREGWRLEGWYASPDPDPDKDVKITAGTDGTVFTASITVYAYWVEDTTPPGPGDQFTVTFDSQGGSAVASQTVAGGGKVTQPTNPTRTGYTFAGWFKEAACTTAWNFGTDTVAGNTTLYAKWTSNGTTPPGPGDQFTVTFDPNGGTGGGPLVTGTDGRLEALPGIPVRAGYVFEGWYTAVSGGTQVTTATVFTQNVTVYARWRSQTAPTVRHRIYTPYRTPGGSLYVSHTYAAEGTRVTIEVDPRTNFELDWISVTNLDTGRELRLTSRYGDEYTFTMPDGDVEVDAAFTGRSSGGSSSGYVPADPPRQQASVKPVRWYYRNGSIYHVTDGLVPAASPLTRDMLVSVLYNMDETSSGDQELWATGSAILPNIYDSGLWGTDMALSREQAAMILFQYARYKGYNISQRTGIEGYYDYAQVRPVARIAVSWARAAGLINGTSANALSPKSQLSCGEANVILSRFTANVA